MSSGLTSANTETLSAVVINGFTVHEVLSPRLEDLIAQQSLVRINSSFRDVIPTGTVSHGEFLQELGLLTDFVLDIDAAIGQTVIRELQTQGMTAAQAQRMVRDANFDLDIDLLEELIDDPDELELILELIGLGFPIEEAVVAAQGTVNDGWRNDAFEAAGIDPAEWRPEMGAEFNRDTIIAVYEYYGDLFLEDPDLQWAGMANMVGPAFASGFFELAQFREIAGDAEAVSSVLRGDADWITVLASLTEEEIAYYEVEFLTMQQEIFVDMAPMHEAYNQAGMAGITAMWLNGEIDRQTFAAWVNIDAGKETGDQERIAAGTTGLVFREQHDIIGDNYDRMFNRPGTGPAVTYALSAVGTPSIPGAQPYGDVFPLEPSFETPGPENLGTPGFGVGVGDWHWFDVGSTSFDNPTQGTVTIETNWPDGNIAHFDDRWKLLEEDTMPAYQALLAEPGAAEAVISTPVAERIEESGVDYIGTAVHLMDIDVDYDQ